MKIKFRVKNAQVTGDVDKWDELEYPKKSLVAIDTISGLWYKFDSPSIIYFIDTDKQNEIKGTALYKYIQEAIMIRRNNILNILFE